MKTTELKEQLKRQIIQFLNLTDLTPADISATAPLFGDGLGLDSIESLELIVLMKKEYGIDIRDPREGRKVLVDVATMADYIEQNGKK